MRVYQFRHFGNINSKVGASLVAPLFERGKDNHGTSSPFTTYFFALGLGAALAGEAACCAGDVAGAGVAAGDGCGVGLDSASGAADCKTEREPVIAGNESISANNINAAAAPIVILLRMLCVPRGPKAVLETLLEKSAPASALPG